jgi:hypothetical protein
MNVRLRPQSVSALFIKSCLTFGLYNLKWISDIQRQLAAAGIVTAKLGPILFVHIISAACSLLGVLLMGTLIFAPNVVSPPSPQPNCWAAYVIHQSVVHGELLQSGVDASVAYTTVCQQQVEDYFYYMDISGYWWWGFAFGIVFGIVLVPIYMLFARRWYSSFSLGIQKATNGRVSGYLVAFLLSAFGPIGIALIQKEINRVSGNIK